MGRNTNAHRQRKHTRDPRDESAESSKRRKPERRGGSSKCVILRPENRHGAGEAEASVPSYLPTIFHWSISELMTGRSSLILPEEDADFKGSLGSKK